jgi:hypothetical protein
LVRGLVQSWLPESIHVHLCPPGIPRTKRNPVAVPNPHLTNAPLLRDRPVVRIHLGALPWAACRAEISGHFRSYTYALFGPTQAAVDQPVGGLWLPQTEIEERPVVYAGCAARIRSLHEKVLRRSIFVRWVCGLQLAVGRCQRRRRCATSRIPSGSRLTVRPGATCGRLVAAFPAPRCSLPRRPSDRAPSETEAELLPRRATTGASWDHDGRGRSSQGRRGPGSASRRHLASDPAGLAAEIPRPGSRARPGDLSDAGAGLRLAFDLLPRSEGGTRRRPAGDPEG